MSVIGNRFSALMLALVVAPAMVAQESTGSIRGTVRAKGGEVLAGVQVRFASPALQGVRTVVTDSQGSFRAPLLPPGSYRLTFSKAGFAASHVDVQVGLGQVVRQEVGLAPVKEASAVVEVVSASASAVDKSDVKTSTNISSEEMDVLPRATRGMDTVALLAPGVTANSAVDNRISIRGAQTTQNRFLLNGTDIADNVFGNTNGRAFYVDDSVEETQVIQSPVNARYGNFTGGVINAITKSGGNEFTGIWRTNLNRTSWSAEAPRGLRPGIAPANAGNTLLEDRRSATHTLLVGGPIIKDVLWFSLSTKLIPQTSAGRNFPSVAGLTTYDGHEPAYIDSNSGAAFSTTSDTKFYEGKLTWAITPNHTVDGSSSYNEVKSSGGYQAAPFFDPACLIGGKSISKYYSVGYRGLLSSSLNLEARYSDKRSENGIGGNPNAALPQRIQARYSDGRFYSFNNGAWNAGSPDNRNAKTLTAHITWFSPETRAGSHTLEGGFEGLRRERAAANDQTPTGIRMYVSGRNADGTYRATTYDDLPGYHTYIGLGTSDSSSATTDTLGVYLNDTWAINSHIQVMAGVRYDKVKASDTTGAETISTDGISPRFQVTYDPRGDQSWIFRGSWARYVGQLHDGFTNKFTSAGSPTLEYYLWKGPASNPGSNRHATYNDLVDLRNWDFSASGFLDLGGPMSNKVDPNLKAPYTDEISLSATHAYQNGSYIRLTLTRRDSKRSLNDFQYIGNEMPYTLMAPKRFDPNANIVVPLPITYWKNDNDIERKYTSAEFEFNFRLSKEWSFGGNYTWSKLKGNGEGADSSGANYASTGDVQGDYEESHRSRNRPVSYYAPNGYLDGDQRHRVVAHLDYRKAFESGATFTSSLLFNYGSGTPISITRSNFFEASDDGRAAGSSAYYSYPTSYTRYWGYRGMGRTNDTYNADLKLAVDVPIVKKLRYYLEVTVYNVFNVWQFEGYDMSADAGGEAFVTDGPRSGYRASVVKRGATGLTGFGTYGYENYTGGRSVTISTGLKW